MKKVVVALFCMVMIMIMPVMLYAAETSKTEGINVSPEFYSQADLSVLKGKKLGITIQSLQNTYWAGVMKALDEILTANGAKFTIVGCEDNSARQIGQIENFVSSMCDFIMIHPSDAAAIEDVCAEARREGVKVMCWDDPMENTDVNWILNNIDLGKAIGQLTGEFINEHYSPEKKAQVMVIGYPQTKVLLEREEGIRLGMEETAGGKYEIIASQAGLDANTAQTAVETILQRYPDFRVVVGVCAGAMIGADEALQIHTGGKIPEDMAVITTDVTKQQLDHIADPSYPARGLIGFEGSDEDTAMAAAKMFALTIQGKTGAHNIFRGFTRINTDNVEAIKAGMK